jgi:8-oxo-dGTP pyrophosphatase MutT (NUDIX family)
MVFKRRNIIGGILLISIKGKEESFSFRIAGIFVHKNRILLQKAIKSGAWVLPGGRSEVNETSGEALIREMKEELGVEISIKRLVWVIENFNAYETKGLHELGFYYLGQLNSECNLHSIQGDFEGNENNIKLVFRWFDINEIRTLDINPKFLRDHLNLLPENIQHVVNEDIQKAIKLQL